jgi:hypothetical protein
VRLLFSGWGGNGDEISFAFGMVHRQYRYETLLAIDAPLDVELKLMDEIAVKYLKTYQVWHHRRLLLTITRKPAQELDFITRSLTADTKNYHTWSYRQWLLAYFNDEDDLWKGELDFVDTMLAQDVRNNSAWHHRFFVVWGCGVREGEEDRERVYKRELTYVLVFLSSLPPPPHDLDVAGTSNRTSHSRRTTCPHGTTSVGLWNTRKRRTLR